MKALLDILPFLTVIPYALLYFLILLSASLLALLALRKPSPYGYQAAPALRAALFVVFTAQLLLLTLSLLIFQGISGLDRYYPLIFHTLTLITLIWLTAGLHCDRFKSRQVRLPVFLSALALLAGTLSVLAWSTWPPEKPFSGSAFSLAWSGAALLLLLVGLMLALRSKRPHKLERVLILLIAALGYLLYVLYPEGGELPAGVMLSQLLYYPLLISAAWQSRHPEQSRNVSASSPQMAAAFLDLGLLERVSEIRAALTHALSLYLMGDLVGIMEKDPQTPAFNVSNVYDLISESFLPTFQLPFKQVPKLRRHFEDLLPLIANTDEQLSGEKQVIMQASGYNAAGSLMLYPLSSPGQTARYALLCVNPYTNRLWTENDLEALRMLSGKLNQVLDRAALVEAGSALKDESRYLNNQKEREKSDLASALSESRAEISALRAQRAGEQAAQAAEFRVCQERQKYLEAQLDHLNENLQAQTEALTELDALRQQKVALEQALEQNEQRANTLRQELAHSHALLADLLGKTESSTNLQDNTSSAQSDSNPSSRAVPQSPLSQAQEALQSSLDETAATFYAKRVALNASIDKLPDLGQPDLSRLQKILESLTINAFAASPLDGEVVVEVRPVGAESKSPALEILCTHAGVGITPDDQKRLPELLSDPESAALNGVGDFAALREAAGLLRACGGHWWLKSEPGSQTTWRALFLSGANPGSESSEHE